MTTLLVNAGRATIPMQGRHLKWLNDGASFFAHAAELIAIKLAPRCKVCGGEGKFSERDETHVEFSCKCKHGQVDATKASDVQPLLMALGWDLCCTDCGNQVSGENVATATRFTVDCECTTRVYSLAVH